MAMDVTDGFTLGGLDNAPGGNSVRILHCAGEIVGLDGNGVYTVDTDGTVTESGGGDAADLSMTNGAGIIITVTNHDPDSTGAGVEGAFCEMKFTFGSAVATTNCLQILGGVGSAGIDDAGGTVGSLAVDHACCMSLVAISGNSITFALSQLEEEGGTQTTADAAQGVKFSVIAFAAAGGIV